MKNKKICIIGYGSHVKKTIIPSLNLKKENIKFVTKKKIKNYDTFFSIEEAVKKLSKDYIFFNSTPPESHFLTSKLILSSGFNIIIEKPICLNERQLIKLNDISKKKKLFMFENMMYFYSKQFILFKKVLRKKKDIKSIDIKFSIPSFNRKSFRLKNSLQSSILYDMGCYPFSLISYFSFNYNNLVISHKIKNKKLIFIKSSFVSKKIKFKITIAIYRKYENYVKVNFNNNTSLILNHFFYGKKIVKKIT